MAGTERIAPLSRESSFDTEFAWRVGVVKVGVGADRIVAGSENGDIGGGGGRAGVELVGKAIWSYLGVSRSAKGG